MHQCQALLNQHDDDQTSNQTKLHSIYLIIILYIFFRLKNWILKHKKKNHKPKSSEIGSKSWLSKSTTTFFPNLVNQIKIILLKLKLIIEQLGLTNDYQKIVKPRKMQIPLQHTVASKQAEMQFLEV